MPAPRAPCSGQSNALTPRGAPLWLMGETQKPFHGAFRLPQMGIWAICQKAYLPFQTMLQVL